MRSTNLIATLGLITATGVGTATLLGARGADRVERVDFHTTRTATAPVFDAELRPASDANVREFVIPVTHQTIEIAKGVEYDGWTFGGTVPGPTIRVREGDLVRVTFVNDAPMPHSIDFHSARIAANVAYRTIMMGDTVTFEFTATDPGAYLIHCGTPPITMHVMQGMYMTMIVDPTNGWGTEADEEFVLVQSEFYAQPGASAGAPMIADWKAAMDKRASHVVFNGRAFQYKDAPLEVDEGDRVRFFVVNAVLFIALIVDMVVKPF